MQYQYPASVDPRLVRSYDLGGPSYTSYPTADRFVEAFGDAELRQWLARRAPGGIGESLAVCLHLPSAPRAERVGYLRKELAVVGALLGSAPRIGALCWDAAAAAALSRDEMRALMGALDARFERRATTQCTIAVDARRVAPGTMAFLAGLGFNRVSISAPTFCPKRARRIMEEARAHGFRTVGLALACGLPGQGAAGFARALDAALRLAPEHIALTGGAARAPASRLRIRALAIGRLTRAGYRSAGLDLFARAGECAQRPVDLLGFGACALGQVGPTYYQNVRDSAAYCAALDAGRLPVTRGIELSADDLVRRAVIEALVCHLRLSIEAIELGYLIDFRRYFAAELAALHRLARDGLVEIDPEWITVTPTGQLLLHAVCMVFDRYLRLVGGAPRHDGDGPRFSG